MMNQGEGQHMSDQNYEAPKVTVLGDVTDMTQAAKPGIYFDFPSAAEGAKTPPPPGAPGTVS
jgi:hypothetical protein